MGYFSKLAAALAERNSADNSYPSAKAQLELRMQELQYRLRELFGRSGKKPLCFQNETERRLSGEALKCLRPEDLCTADEVLRAIGQAKQQLAILEGQDYACYANMIPGQMMISKYSVLTAREGKKNQEEAT